MAKRTIDKAKEAKKDEFYNEVCGYYGISSDWPSFNKAKEDFIEIINMQSY